MKWIITYVDVKYDDPLSEVEDRCFQGFEPFAITEFNLYQPPSKEDSLLGPIFIPVKRFWFKKRVKRD